MLFKKYFVVLIISTLIFFSCNNKDEEPKTEQFPLEKQLRADVAKYPDSLAVLEKLIEYYENNGNYDSAIKLTDNALKRDSSFAELWDIKGTLHFENDDTTNAIRSFEKAIELYPLPEYIMSLGSLYAETKNPKALTLADALIISNKAKAEKEALFIKGLYYNYTGNKNKAISYFDSCIHVSYTYMLAYREKAIALYDLGKYEDALQVLTKAVTIENNFDEGYYWMGRCYEKLNRKQDAIESYHNALLYDKDYVEAKDALAKLGEKIESQ